MNDRQLMRNRGRIPRLLWHIERCKAKKQGKRVEGFQQELERRCHEMRAAGYEKELEALLKTKFAGGR